MYAKLRLAIDPAALAVDPLVQRTAENTVAELVSIFDAPPRPGWTDDMKADPLLALGDRCPPRLRDYGWWPVENLRPALGFLQTHGAPAATLDLAEHRVTVTAPVVEPTAEQLAAEYDRIEADLHRRIDIEAETRRLDFITAGDG